MSNYIKAACISCLFFSLNLTAEVIKDDVKIISKAQHSLQEVCSFMLKKSYPLVQKKSKTLVDCMKKDISVINFCLKKYPADPYISRGFIEGKKAICVSAKEVRFKYKCRFKDSLCINAKSACLELKSKLAARLELKQFYMLEEKDKLVSCFYSVPSVKPL